jgi:hypothetical protein
VSWLLASRIFAGLLLAEVLFYFALRIWRATRKRASHSGAEFHPTIGFARQDAFKSIAVLLFNKSDDSVWTEEIEIVLTELVADQQATTATCHEVHKIRQAVPARDMLPISLVETIYNAAGRPQLRYSCVMSSVVRYRVGEERFEEPMKIYRLKMAGLTVSGARQDRKGGHKFKPQGKPQDLQATASSGHKNAISSDDRH